MTATVRRPRVVADLVFSAVLVVLVAAAYSPSLRHAHRADQWCYLVDTMHCRTVPDLLAESYSYNRTRTIGRGDTDLFRPILFVLLAAEKELFGGDLRPPQAVGIALHCGICLLLLALLRGIEAAGPRRPAAAGPPLAAADLLPQGVVAFFALNPCVQELVIWAHLHGYLLFLVFLLGSMILLLRHAAGAAAGSWTSSSLWGAWGLALLSAFTYELGQVYAVLAGLFTAAAITPRVGARRGLAAAAGFASIVIVYQAANGVDRRLHDGRYTPDGNAALVRERAFTPDTPTHAARFVAYTAAQPFFPSVLQSHFGTERLLIPESLWAGHGCRVFSPTLVVSYGVVGVVGVMGLAGLRRLARPGERLPRLTFALAAGLYGAYAAVTVLGRMNLRPGTYALAGNSYYAYPGLLFALVALSAAWAAAGRGGLPTGGLRTGLLAGLVALAGLGAEQVRRVNEEVARALRPFTRPLEAVQNFVASHRDEPGFGFAIDDQASDPIPVVYGVPVTRVLFARWTDSPGPKYRVVVQDGKLQAERGE
ncbi:MAG: hypothetical protein JWO38_6999 [Gemmataceae bacterium]|nr:hypothetical protein [Gemmataceae bacterium]